MRKITSMTLFISFLFLILTSIILYIVPQGRVAYWADWTLWGLSKSEWGNLHINLGFLFLFAGILHMYFNWRLITAYMKNRARELKILTPAFNIALLITVIVGLGTYFEIPPMSSVISLGEAIKDSAAKKYGEPPYGHAELSSLKLFAKKQDLDLNLAIDLLGKKGLTPVKSSDTLADIAAAHKLSPQDIYNVIKLAATDDGKDEKPTFPDSPMSGFGNMTLAEICAEYSLVFPEIRRGLKEKGMDSEAAMTIREIGTANGMEPMTVFEAIHSLVYGDK